MSTIKTISITPEMEREAYENRISWSEAARVGFGILMMEKGEPKYAGTINVFRKIGKLQQELTKMASYIEDLEKLKGERTPAKKPG